MMPLFKKKPAEFDQHLMFPSNIFDLLKDDHDCYVYSEIFKDLDTSEIEKQFSTIGQHAYHPKLITSILIYSYSRGVFSSRQIEQRCNEDLSFMYIAQMGCPNYRVLNDFRKDHHEFFKDCFKQTVKMAIELKLASLGHISLDGSKFKANSSKHKAMSYKNLRKQEKELTEEIDVLIKKAAKCDEEEDLAYKEQTGYELPEDLQHKESRLETIKKAKEALEAREKALHPGKPIDEKKQISFADEDARIMKNKNGFDYCYNPQISVDADNQIIVGQHVSQKANDQQELKPALKEVKQSTGRDPDKMSMDNGYFSGDNLEAIEDSHLDAYVATNKDDKKNKDDLSASTRRVEKSDFDYNETDNTFTCPQGQVLEMKREDKKGKRIYQADIEKCKTCPFHKRCSQSKKGEARTLSSDKNEKLRQQMTDKMEQAESKDIYHERKVIVEPVFGQIKNTGFRGFSVRGKDKVAGEFSLICAVHNIKKIIKAVTKGLVYPKKGKQVENVAI
ncbi:MAG: IS1182 family transposase [Gammaproteobacteria bacterium]|nr:IS1182 family transposase [Gammaproteobacteria bacterium]